MSGFFGETESVYDSPAERRKKQLDSAYANLRANFFRSKEAFRSTGQKVVDYIEAPRPNPIVGKPALPSRIQSVQTVVQNVSGNVGSDVYASKGKGIFSQRKTIKKKGLNRSNPKKLFNRIFWGR